DEQLDQGEAGLTLQPDQRRRLVLDAAERAGLALERRQRDRLALQAGKRCRPAPETRDRSEEHAEVSTTLREPLTKQRSCVRLVVRKRDRHVVLDHMRE